MRARLGYDVVKRHRERVDDNFSRRPKPLEVVAPSSGFSQVYRVRRGNNDGEREGSVCPAPIRGHKCCLIVVLSSADQVEYVVAR